MERHAAAGPGAREAPGPRGPGAGARAPADSDKTEADGEKTEIIVAIVTEPRFTQHCRKYLEKHQLLDKCHRVKQLPDGTMALPVLEEGLTEQHLQALRQQGLPESTYRLTHVLNPLPSKKAQNRSPAQKLRQEVRRLVEGQGRVWSAELEKDLPRSWQRHSDLILLNEESFRAAHWKKLEPGLWKTVASALGGQRLAKRGRVSPGGTRAPKVTLLLGAHGWVEHVDNGIRYTFDVTQSMFSFGNITEKLRVASMTCAGEVLVDLYAGIGYFTLPFLIHANAAFVHACEWDPHAAAALRKNLELNGVADRCHIHLGDNRKAHGKRPQSSNSVILWRRKQVLRGEAIYPCPIDRKQHSWDPNPGPWTLPTEPYLLPFDNTAFGCVHLYFRTNKATEHIHGKFSNL